MKKAIKIALMLASAFMLFSCELIGNENDNESSGVDFSSHNTNYSILVRNNTGERLIAFKGSLGKNTLIGGIPAHAQNHGLPKDTDLFDKTEDFPLILLTESQYEKNKKDLNSQRNSPFTRVYVFYNKNGDNSAVYEIAEGLGGNNNLRIINPSTSMNVELRLGGVAGETIGYAPAGILETTLKLNDGNYNIFPVFKRYNKTRDIVETVYPKGVSDAPWFITASFGDFGPPTGIINEFSMNLKDLLGTLTMTSGAAWVVINNQTVNSGLRFWAGGTVYKTASGLENVMPGYSVTFMVEMDKVGNNYTNSKTISNWKFGPTGYEVELQESETDNTKVQSLVIERDKMYTITVKGDHNAGTLKAWVSDTTSIDVSDFNMN